MTEFKFLVRVLDQAHNDLTATAVFTSGGVPVGERGSLGQNELVVFQNISNKPNTDSRPRLGVCGTRPIPLPEGASEAAVQAYYDRLRRETVLPSQTGTGPGQRRYPTYPAALLTYRLPVEASNWQGLTPTQFSYDPGPQVYLFDTVPIYLFDTSQQLSVFSGPMHCCPPGSLADSRFNVWRVTDIHVRPYP